MSSGELPSRSALGDVTNQVLKRGFCSILNSDVKSAKKECRRVDDICKENDNNKEIVACVLRPHSCGEIDRLQGDVNHVINSVSKVVCEVKESCPPGVGQNVAFTLSAADVVSDSCQHAELVHTIPLDENGRDVIVEGDEDDERTESTDVLQMESKGIGENKVGADDGNDVSVDNLDSSKDENIDCSRFPESQESICGLEKCIVQKGDGLSNECMDMIKACSCSFCMKAAQLWTDLHYQDIKGRMAVIKKSQKEATILVDRNSRGVARNDKFSNLESDLTGRWKSLFLHMEDIFVREGTQLEASLSTLKEVIDNCKTETENN